MDKNIPYYTFTKPTNNITHFRDPMGVNFTLIEGCNLAILFDTGYGLSDTKKLIDSIVKTPYIVINSHGHMDHTSGNYQFPKVYINPIDYKLYKENNTKEIRTKDFEKALSKGLTTSYISKEEYVNANIDNTYSLDLNKEIDLGNITIQIIPMEGHTKGSIGLLLKEQKFLLTADAAISNIWMFLKESTPVPTYIKMLERVKQLNFENFLTGHLSEVFPKRFFDYYIDLASKATPNNSKLVEFEGFSRSNTYCYQKMYEDHLLGICYYKKK